jgi:hypothetical protein
MASLAILTVEGKGRRAEEAEERRIYFGRRSGWEARER